jgi:hypothetical protein
MQNKVKIFQFILFIPVLFWLVAKPISLTSVEKIGCKIEEKSHSKRTADSKQTQVYAVQHVYQAAANLQFDFPSDWNFVLPIEFVSIQPFNDFKLPAVIHRTQFMRILLTQFIATLAP